MTTIVSIQSSVAYGHVGNSAATFPLMRMGCEVMPVLTVHFAASTIYGPPRGPLLTPEQVGDVVGGMDDLGVFADVDAVLSGFQGAPAMCARIVESVKTIKERSDKALYCCDPVMGDVDRGFFVTPGLPELIRDEVIPLADIVTPNLFELNFLTGREAASQAEIVDAARALAAQGPKVVLVTSATASEDDPQTLSMIAIEGERAWKVTTPKLERVFTGSGDVTAATFLAHYLRTGSVADALGATADVMYSLLKITTDLDRKELALVPAQDEFVHPSFHFEVAEIA